MKPTQLDRVIKLVRRTGDRVLVMDRDSDEVMAIMNLDDYEKLLNGRENVEEMTETDFLDKINRDIALWRECHKEEVELDEVEVEAEKEVQDFVRVGDMLKKDEISKDVSEPVVVPLPTEQSSQEIVELPQNNVKNVINSHNGMLVEESLLDVPDDGEEEKFYMEPVE